MNSPRAKKASLERGGGRKLSEITGPPLPPFGAGGGGGGGGWWWWGVARRVCMRVKWEERRMSEERVFFSCLLPRRLSCLVGREWPGGGGGGGVGGRGERGICVWGISFVCGRVFVCVCLSIHQVEYLLPQVIRCSPRQRGGRGGGKRRAVCASEEEEGGGKGRVLPPKKGSGSI